MSNSNFSNYIMHDKWEGYRDMQSNSSIAQHYCQRQIKVSKGGHQEENSA